MASKITLTFNSIPSLDSIIRFGMVQTLGGLGLQINETFKAVRTGIGESEISTLIGDNGIIDTAEKYSTSINNDYNSTNIFTRNIASLVAPTVLVIESTNPILIFELYENTTTGDVDILIENDATVPFLIDSVTSLEALSSPCSNIRLSVQTSEQADSIVSPISQIVGSNPFIFDTVRADSISVVMEKDGGTHSLFFRAPQLLSTFFDLDIINTPSGGTLTVIRNGAMAQLGTGTFLLDLEYSIDNIVWSPANSWSGIEDGSHTLYIRDNRGCEITMPFTIDALSPNLADFDPVCEISNINSIRFKEDVAWVNCGIRKNKYNTLSYEENVSLPKNNFMQLFQTCDSPKTQIKSNYSTHTVTVTDADGNITPITTTAVTANMNNTDVRDGHFVSVIGSEYLGQVGLYFGSGNTYDPDTLLQNGSYNLGFEPMDWVNIGDYANIEGIGWVLIQDIIIQAPTNSRILVLAIQYVDFNFTSPALKVTTVYNVVDFERFEFTIPFDSLGEGCYQVSVACTDSVFDDKNFLSEWINVKEEHDCHHLFKYYHTITNEIRWSTGIMMILRLPYVVSLTYSNDNQEDIVVLDTQTVPLENRNRIFDSLNLRPIPTMMADKVSIMLSQDKIELDGVTYVKEGEPEQRRIGVTNEYQVTASLVESDYVFKSASGLTLSEVLLPSGTPLNIDESSNGLLFVD